MNDPPPPLLLESIPAAARARLCVRRTRRSVPRCNRPRLRGGMRFAATPEGSGEGCALLAQFLAEETPTMQPWLDAMNVAAELISACRTAFRFGRAFLAVRRQRFRTS